MKLTREQRRRILAGEHLSLAWARIEDCPFEVNEVVVLKYRRGPDAPIDPHYPPPDLVDSPLVWITITQLRRTKKGGVVAQYRVRDDRPRFLAPGDGYTSAAAFSIDSETEALDDEVHKRLHRESDVASSMRREVQRQREEKVRLEFGLARARKKGRRATVVAMEQRLKRIKGRFDEAA